MGIPTVNGAVYFDDRYLGNPLVYCGNVGLLPVNKVEKHAVAGDLIVAIGGRTGPRWYSRCNLQQCRIDRRERDISGGAVQIGNAITERWCLMSCNQPR